MKRLVIYKYFLSAGMNWQYNYKAWLHHITVEVYYIKSNDNEYEYDDDPHSIYGLSGIVTRLGFII